jgi:hypothetical protein
VKIFRDYWDKKPHAWLAKSKKRQIMSFEEKESAKKQTDKLKQFLRDVLVEKAELNKQITKSRFIMEDLN